MKGFASQKGPFEGLAVLLSPHPSQETLVAASADGKQSTITFLTDSFRTVPVQTLKSNANISHITI